LIRIGGDGEIVKTGMKLVLAGTGLLMMQGIVRANDVASTETPFSRNMPVDANAYPWMAVAKLNNGSGGFCTAVRISADYALTAAHCLYYRSTARFLPAESFHLVFGYQKQGFREHVRVAGYHIAYGYDPSRPYESLELDWALLSVASPAKVAIFAPLVAEPTPLGLQAHLMTAGYSHLVPYAMTADQRCQMMGRSLDKKLLFDTCSAPAGYSGAPLLTFNPANKRVELAGIHVANQAAKNSAAAIAIPIESIWPEIKLCIEAGRCDFNVVASGKDPPASEILAGQKTSDSGVTGSFCNFRKGDCTMSLTGP
jgi:hypothetical protein